MPVRFAVSLIPGPFQRVVYEVCRGKSRLAVKRKQILHPDQEINDSQIMEQIVIDPSKPIQANRMLFVYSACRIGTTSTSPRHTPHCLPPRNDTAGKLKVLTIFTWVCVIGLVHRVMICVIGLHRALQCAKRVLHVFDCKMLLVFTGACRFRVGFHSIVQVF